MTLRTWLKPIDTITKIRIWGNLSDKPLFEGWISDIPWTLVDLKIDKPEEDDDPPIFLCIDKNEHDVTFPTIIAHVLED